MIERKNRVDMERDVALAEKEKNLDLHDGLITSVRRGSSGSGGLRRFHSRSKKKYARRKKCKENKKTNLKLKELLN
jgi:hypothetical protein